MNLDRAVLLLAGTITLISALFAALVSPWWLLLTGFVGLNLVQSSVTGLCPAVTLLRATGPMSGIGRRSRAWSGGGARRAARAG